MDVMTRRKPVPPARQAAADLLMRAITRIVTDKATDAERKAA